MDGFVSAYSKTTGKKQRIPARWIGHPILGRNFEVVPSAREALADVEEVPGGRAFFVARGGQVHATDDPAGDPVVPAESWVRDRLDTYAREVHDLDTTGLPNKGEVLAAITEAETNQDSDDDPSPDQTPATGEEEE